jgi:hypothetical protein
MEDTQFFLPSLKRDKKITPPAKTGLWKNDAKTIIRGISDAIETSEEIQGVSSIPDIWARPLMFQNFLYSVYKKITSSPDKKPSLNAIERRAFQEWKGLLSLLALKETKLRFENIEVIPFKLTEDDRFCRALKGLSPNPVFLEKDKQYLWTDILLINYNKVPVGAFSPSTLVYTAIDYNRDFVKKFDLGAGKSSIILDENGFLCPPSKQEDLLAIGEWVFNVKKNIGMLLNTRDEKRETDKTIATMISALLDVWINEIRETFNVIDDGFDTKNQVKISESIPYFEENKIPDFLSRYQIYNVLLHPLESGLVNVNENKSDIELEFRRNLYKFEGKDIEHVLLISDKLYNDDFRLWDQLRYSSLGSNISNILTSYFSAVVGQDIKGKEISLINEHVLWIRPEVFFLTDTLLVSKKDEKFLSEFESKLNISSKYVLPFKKEILDFYTPEEIRDLLSPSYDDKGDKVIFSFKLPIKNNRNDLQIKKIYKKKNPEQGEGLILEANVPVVEIFPDYLGSNWRRYFLFQNQTDFVSTIPICNGGNVKSSLRNYNVNIEDKNEKVKIIELIGDNPFPDGIEIVSSNRDNIGLVLLDKYLNIDKDNILKNNLEIGIDFGTSNTNVYFKEDNADGKRWCYDFPKYIRQISNSNNDLRRKILNESFIPTREFLLPISTALLNRYNTKEVPSLLLDYFIFFTKKDKDYVIPKNVYTNLKWGEDNNNHSQLKSNDAFNNTDGFIQCLLFLIFIEVSKRNCKEITINCTYPKAFSEDETGLFIRFWEMALNSLLFDKENRILDVHNNKESFNPNVNKPVVDGPYLLTEGKAAGYFFANPSKFTSTKQIEGAKLADGAVCIDVGGGTTDISIWFDSGSIAFYDTSVLLAGKGISDFIKDNPEIYHRLFSNEAADALKEKGDNSASFAAVLNLILKAEEKDVYNNLAKNINNPSFQSLRKMILLEFGAIAYYTAILCKAAINKSNGNGLLEKIENTGISIYWGGNGSKFISWLDYGQFNPNSNCVKLLNTIFFYALKFHGINPFKGITQFASPEPKSEACGGIIVSEFSERYATSKGKSVNVNTDNSGIIPGLENIFEVKKDSESDIVRKSNEFVNGEKVETTDNLFIESFQFIADSDLFKGNKTIVRNTSLEELEILIKLLNQAGLALGLIKEGNQINLNENNKAKIKSSITNVLKLLQDKSPDKRRLEPIFILEVKELIHLMLMNLI